MEAKAPSEEVKDFDVNVLDMAQKRSSSMELVWRQTCEQDALSTRSRVFCDLIVLVENWRKVW